jgi:serine/threonine-protein kinase
LAIIRGCALVNLVEQEATRAFGHYQELGVLGDGALGRLFVAENRGGESGPTIVAVRGFHRELSADARFGKTLADAVRVASGLKHPNLAAVYELGELDGGHFLTMEYLPGESLTAILAKCAAPKPMPPAMAAAIVHQCAEAMRYAHEVRDVHGAQIHVVHRDIRPENIFVTYQGTVKVVGTGEGLLRSRVIELRSVPPNSLAYTAPEGVEAASDARVDVFSMGVVLWECLTGRPLFHGDSAAKVQEAIRARYIEPPSVFNPEVVSGLDEVALRSLARDPRRRYQTAKEMSLAIDTAILAMGRRPTPAAMADWMESLFGAERATLKTQIARGGAVPGALGRLRLLGGDPQSSKTGRTDLGIPAVHHPAQLPPPGGSRQGLRPLVPLASPPLPPEGLAPRVEPEVRPGAPAPTGADAPAGWDGGVETVKAPAMPVAVPAASPPPAPAARGSRVRWVIVGVAAAASVTAGAVLGLRGPGTVPAVSQPVSAPASSLEISSTPPGAQVLIDGDPSGLVTPAHVTGLGAGRKVEIRVDKPGYRSEKQITDVPASGSRALSFKLVESVGEVRLQSLPPQSTTYVDDVSVDGSHPLELSVGPHRLRVEVAGKLFSTMKLDVRPGGQNVVVRPSEGTTK